ncbi:MAG: hypothetical protein IGS23_00545 [Rivularia sp. T60_A2020_040]|nr:hypothetical protein [Rivularia sp. T60_A2020_040]
MECAINGLGARKGNADLEVIIGEAVNLEDYQSKIDTSLMSKASDLVAQITGINLEMK